MKTGWFKRVTRWVLHRLLVVIGAIVLTLVLFLVLPVLESINSGPKENLIIQSVDTANVPPPPPPPEEEKKQEPDQEKQPPKLNEEAPPLDLSQLELALNPGGGGGEGLLPDMTNKLAGTAADGADDVDTLFSLSDLDQKPRVMYQPSPVLDAQLRKSGPATVYILFVVDQNGRVQDAKVQNATNPLFESAALSAVKKWKFEPGKRSGEAVRFRMRVPITFPKD